MKIRDIANHTAKMRSRAMVDAEQKSVPSRLWEGILFGQGMYGTANNWTKRELIEQAYSRNPAFYAAVNIIAQTVADIPIYVQYVKDGKKYNTSEHPMLRMLNRNSTLQELIELFTKFFVVTGDGYSQMVMSQTSKAPLGCIVMPSHFVDPIQGNYMRPIMGYKYTEHKEVYFPESEIIHVYNPGLAKYFESISPGSVLAEHIDLNNAAVTWNKNLALAGGVPPVVARANGMNSNEAQKVKEAWRAQRGANNHHELSIISENLEIEKLGTTPHDAEWGQAILQAMRVIFMTMGVSSSLMNDAGNKTYNNVHDSRKALYQEGAIPLAHKIYNAFTRKLQPYYSDNPTIVVDTENIDVIQEDKKIQAERLERLVRARIMTPNEARTELRLRMSDDPQANMLMDSSVVNNIPKVDRPQDAPPTETQPEPTL